MRYIDPAFFDIDVRRAVFSHGAQLHDVGLRAEGPDGKYQVGRDIEVVVEGQQGGFAVEHGIRRGGLFGIVDDSVGRKGLKKAFDKGPVGEIADKREDFTTADIMPGGNTPCQIGNFAERRHVLFAAQGPPQVVVGHRDFMTAGGEMHGRGPSEIAVATQDQYAHL